MAIGEFDAFHERRRALEDAFFRDRDQQLLEKLQGELYAFEEKHKLAHVSGILDEKILMDLVQAGVSAESLLAMRFVPLVLVAWADNKVTPEERAAILAAEAEEGITPGSAPHELLERWLDERPDERIEAAWQEYVCEAAKVMPKESIAEMKKKALARCQRVAHASGGFLGYGAVSPFEQAAIDKVARAFEGLK
jgi:hypothetical protein